MAEETTLIDTAYILREVQSKTRDYINQSGIDVSIQAQELITSVYSSFLFDPHPGWQTGMSEKHTQNFDELLNKLPDFLQQIATLPTVTNNKISSFDVIYWLSQNMSSICPYICPF